jgi:hypothetical protein
MLVGISGSGKSPGGDTAVGPLREFETELWEGFAELLRQWATAKAEAWARREKWEAELNAAVKKGQPVPSMPADAGEPERPARTRLLLQDVTPEKLLRVVAGNRRAVLVYRDEIAGLLDGFGRYHAGGKGGAERAIWIEAFNARPYVVDRVKDEEAGPIAVKRLSVVVCGGIQPERLAQLLLRSADDGLAARFLFVWPDAVPPQRPRVFGDNSILPVFRRLSLIKCNDDDQPVIMTLEEPAVVRFQQWREQHAAKLKTVSGLFASWLAKQFGYILRLAGLLKLLDWAIEDGTWPPPASVTTDAIERAITLLEEYLSPMAERTFGDASLPDDERGAATIAKLIIARRLGSTQNGSMLLNLRSVQRLKLPLLRTADQVKAAFAILQQEGWLRPAPSRRGERQGRQRDDYEVNPLVFVKSNMAGQAVHD